jgi:hypothetical protein
MALTTRLQINTRSHSVCSVTLQQPVVPQGDFVPGAVDGEKG